MKNEIPLPDFSCVESILREYGKNHDVNPDQVINIFHEGIVAIAEKYPEDHPLRIAVMRGALPAGKTSTFVQRAMATNG